jgi:hypothetical protein
LQERAQSGPPFAVAGPPGAGKTWVLLALADALASAGWEPLYLDLMGAASSPERFVRTAGESLPARTVPRSPSHAEWVHAVLAGWASLRERAGRPVSLLLDEATEIRSLAYFKGLREVHQPFGAAVLARPRGTVLATSFPTLARRLWPSLAIVEVPPLTEAEVASVRPDVDAGRVVALTAGRPRSVRALLEETAERVDVFDAWAAAMGAGGRLESAYRHTYESLLLRSRGYGMSKAVLAVVAAEEGLNLTALVGRLGRTPGAIRDYLGWLVAVDAIRMVKKKYHYVDPLLGAWVRLHATGRPPHVDAIREEARRLAGAAAGAPDVAATPMPPGTEPPARPDETPERAPRPSRDDGLIEID